MKRSVTHSEEARNKKKKKKSISRGGEPVFGQNHLQSHQIVVLPYGFPSIKVKTMDGCDDLNTLRIKIKGIVGLEKWAEPPY